MRYDVIVVGGGSAGAIIAARLSEDAERSVLLLEAGADYPDFASMPAELRQGGMPTGPRGPGLTRDPAVVERTRWELPVRFAPRDAVPRAAIVARVMGGGSAINATYFGRGVPEDFDLWASQGNDLWGWEQVLPFFTRMETDVDFGGDAHHGDCGPIRVSRLPMEHWSEWDLAFRQAALEAGYPEHPDHNHPDATGLSPMPSNNVEGLRYSTAMAYLRPAAHRPNLNVKTGSLVRRVLFDGRRAAGVEAESDGEVFVAEAEEVMLCAGALFSPAILMRSGVGPGAHLHELGIPVVADLAGVGQNLREHPHVFPYWKIDPASTAEPPTPAMMPVRLRFTAQGSDMRNDLQISILRHIGGNGREPFPGGLHHAMNCALYFELSAGEVRLASANPDVPPLIDYRFLSHPFDRERLREVVRVALDLAASPHFEGILGDLVEPTAGDLASDEALDRYLDRSTVGSYHATGTAKMGPASDPLAVVDQFGCVHGVAGLRVADASIMPHCVRSPINATCLMIGERVADLVRSAR